MESGQGRGGACSLHPTSSIIYLRSSTMLAGFSRKSFHMLEKRHMVAPSMTRWSADQLTFMMWAGTT